jgi:hypothetical protein
MSIYTPNDEGASIIVGQVPYEKVGQVLATPDTQLDTNATLHLGIFNYSGPDDNGKQDYSARERAISKLTAHSGFSGNLWPNNPVNDGVHANFFTAPRTGVFRFISTAGQGGYGGPVYVNDALFLNSAWPYQEQDSNYIMLYQGDVVGAYSTNTQMFYTYLPNIYPY